MDNHKSNTKKHFNLYAVIDIRNQLVKFGKSLYPTARFKELQTGNGNKLVFAGFCPEDKLSEKNAHEELSSIRVSGEWFKLNKLSRSVIDRMRGLNLKTYIIVMYIYVKWF